jgi:hypothetical protein
LPTFHRYSISNRKRLIDSEPVKRGELPLVWLKDRHEWVEMEVGSGEHVDSVPITDEEAQIICETGEIPQRISQYVRLGMPEFEEEIRDGFPFSQGDEGLEKKRSG